MLSVVNAVDLMQNDFRTVLVQVCHLKCSLKMHFSDFGSFFENKDMHNTSISRALKVHGKQCWYFSPSSSSRPHMEIKKMISKIMNVICACDFDHLHACVLEKLKFNKYTDVKCKSLQNSNAQQVVKRY